MPCYLFSQVYSDVQLNDFVEIYFSEKEIRTFDENEVRSIFEKNEYDRNDIISRNTKKKDSLTVQKELQLKYDIDLYQQQIDLVIESKLRQLCYQKSMPYDLYIEIKNKFRSDLKFHRSLQPYFTQFFKSKDDE